MFSQLKISQRVCVPLSLVICLVAAFFWARSYTKDSPGACRLLYVSPTRCYYLTSFIGWVRAGSICFAVAPPPSHQAEDLGMGVMFAVLPGPMSREDPPGFNLIGSTYAGGLVRTCNFQYPELRARGLAVPHWLICVVFFAYPAIVLSKKLIIVRRRRRRGLCMKCG